MTDSLYLSLLSFFLSVQYSAADWSGRSLLPAVQAWLTTLRFWSGKSLLFQHLQRERESVWGRKKIDQSFILSLYQPQRWLPELCVYVSVALSLTLTFLPLVAAPLPATYTTTIPSSEERERETRDSIHILDLRACWTLPTYYRLLLPYDHLQKGENARDRACPSNSWVKEGETHTRRYRGEAASSYRQHTLKHRIEKLLKTFLREKFKKKNNNR